MFGTKYNYQRFERERLAKDFARDVFGGAPRPGDRAPRFEGRTLDGELVRLKDFRGRKNVVLTFGSATCPQTARSLPGMHDLYEDREQDTEFFFLYTREAHPGERLPTHNSYADKCHAAEVLRDAEGIEMPIIVDDVDGRIHRRFGGLPNPTFIVDKAGRIAFRSAGTRASVISRALKQLREAQRETGENHHVVAGGEDAAVPSPFWQWRAYRALERGGERSMKNFRSQMGVPGSIMVAGSRAAEPIIENPGKAAAGVLAIAAVLAMGIWGGLLLRRRRLGTYHNPYESRAFQRDRFGDYGDYEAVGI